MCCVCECVRECVCAHSDELVDESVDLHELLQLGLLRVDRLLQLQRLQHVHHDITTPHTHTQTHTHDARTPSHAQVGLVRPTSFLISTDDRSPGLSEMP